ncbi:MAG: hypothetical protein HKP61_19960 [Dactylosporangium sp.]|nr:hypothetical protein [Dactylosporangium sp.]NNJ63160.1 hypothetical protein [Dactylosporangium sp.]
MDLLPDRASVVDETPPRRRPRLTRAGWAAIVLVAWTLAVTGFAVRAVRDGRATAPEQMSLPRALSAADLLAGDLMAAVDAALTVAVMGEYQEVGSSCRITAVRAGSRYERLVTAYVAPGAEADLLSFLASGLAERYETHLTRSADGPVFTAIDRSFVSLRGVSERPGEVKIIIDTGCRPGGFPEPARPGVDQAPSTLRSAATAAFAAIGLTPGHWAAVSVPCRTGGTTWTVRAWAEGPSDALPTALRDLGKDTVVVEQPTAVAYRAGDAGTAVRDVDHVVVVASTAVCVG